MVVALIGESCTGKSTLAAALAPRLSAKVYAGKDYLRLAKGEAEAEARFCALLSDAEEPVIYVLSEREQLTFLPETAFRVLVTAELEEIQARFARRMGGTLPPPLAAALARKHGMFDAERHDLHIVSGEKEPEAACAEILARLGSVSPAV